MKKAGAILIALMLLFGASLNCMTVFAVDDAAWPYGTETDNSKTVLTPQDENELAIVFTQNMHSNMTPVNGKGGFAKIKTLIDETAEKNKDTFVLDSGDFSMGTAFQMIFASEAPELVTMGYMGYDVTTFGADEYSLGFADLSSMLKAAMKTLKSKEQTDAEKKTDEYNVETTVGVTAENEYMLPSLVCANIDWDKTVDDSSDKREAKLLKKMTSKYGMNEYSVVEKENYKIAVFGLLDKGDGEAVGLAIKDPAESAADTVKKIKDKEGDVDLIVCLSKLKGGVSANKNLAGDVDGIDLIINGGSKKAAKKQKKINDTVIAAADSDAEGVGIVAFNKNEKGKLKFKNFETKTASSETAEEKSVADIIEQYKYSVDSNYFYEFGFSMSQVLAGNKYKFTSADKFGIKQGEDSLGNLISDAFIRASKRVGRKADVAVLGADVITASLPKGKVTAENVFLMSMGGKGEDGTAGYPLVKIYLTGKELKKCAEADVSLSPDRPEARMYFSGISYKYNIHRLKLNRTYDVKLMDKKGNTEKIVDRDLYSVVIDMKTCERLGTFGDGTYGFLDIEPKDREGKIINAKDYAKHIIKYEKREVKVWSAIADYLDSFRSGNVPKYYKNLHNRKLENNTRNPIKLVSHPNKVAWLFYGIIILGVLILVVILLVLRNFVINKTGGPQEKVERMFSDKQKKKILKRPKKQKKIFSKKKRYW